jgi:hypothetical protein
MTDVTAEVVRLGLLSFLMLRALTVDMPRAMTIVKTIVIDKTRRIPCVELENKEYIKTPQFGNWLPRENPEAL